MKVRENWTYRRLDVAFPRDALKELFDMEMAELKKGVNMRSLASGPLAVGPGRVSGAITHRVMLIDEAHADRIIEQMEAICAKYPVDESEYRGFGEAEEDEETEE